MNRIPRVRRAIAILSGLAIAILGLAAAAPGAFARVMPPSGGFVRFVSVRDLTFNHLKGRDVP